MIPGDGSLIWYYQLMRVNLPQDVLCFQREEASVVLYKYLII